MDKLVTIGLIIIATVLEATGDAVVRMGLRLGQSAWLARSALFLAGGVLLFGYGLSLNLAPVDFGRIVGFYIASLFVVWQIISIAVFRALPDAATLVGGGLIILGGAIVTFWQR